MDRSELRQELLAVLAANRELDRGDDEALVDNLLARFDRDQAQLQPVLAWREIYEHIVPLKLSAVLAIAAAQGLVLFTLADHFLKGLLDFYYYYGGFMVYAWIVYAVIWLAEVVVTIAMLSILTRQRRAARRRTAPRQVGL